jgi:hypothetical protein
MIDRHRHGGIAYHHRSLFVGRTAELDRIGALPAERMELITLVSSGIGKTRLALEAIRRLDDDPTVREFWVTLARLSPAATTPP